MGHGLEVKGGYKGLAQYWPVRLGFTVLVGDWGEESSGPDAPVLHPTQLHAFFSSSSLDWIWTTAWAGMGLLFGCCCCLVAAAAACLQLPFILYALRQYYAFMLAVWTTEPYPYVLFGYLLWCVNHWISTLYAISDFQLPMCYISCFLVHIIQKQPKSGQLKKKLNPG